jgi:hypothetical protein
LIVFRHADLADAVNVGPHTRPETFTLASNLWYCEDRPQRSQPRLPVSETGGLYGVNPRLTAPEKGQFQPRNPQAAPYGASAWLGESQGPSE